MRCTLALLLANPACLSALALVAAAQTAPTSRPPASEIPADARFACPMETHPDESDPARQGAYFSAKEGNCPWCGMRLKPIDVLDWAQARQAAGGADIAYSCPEHPLVFWTGSAGAAPADCPRCGRKLEAFRVMYTCPDPRHAGQISAQAGECAQCGRKLAPYRGEWLAPALAERNLPPHPEIAEKAAYRCPTHPLAHSDRPGKCPLCAADLAPTSAAGHPAKPPAAAGEQFVCPMHPNQTSAARGSCAVCGMRLVAAQAVPKPAGAPAVIAVQVDYVMEHYLALQKRFASDSTRDVALHALGLVGAADEILRRVDDPASGLPAEFREAVRALRAAALRLSGKSLDDDRVTFVGLSGAMSVLVEHVRPSRDPYPAIYLFHCPMTKGDWLQTSEEIANPFYGFKMLKCGEPTGVK